MAMVRPTPPAPRPPRRVPARAPGVGRRTTRVPRTPRPLTHRRPAWRALGVAGRVAAVVATGLATAAVGTAPLPAGWALAWAPDRTGSPSPVPVDASGTAAGDPQGAAAACDAAPNAYNLATAFGKAVKDLIASKTPEYQDSYYGLTYGYDVSGEKLSPAGSGGAVTGTVTGTVTASYHGTAYEKASGKAVSRSGTATATFQWTGCSWAVTDFTY